MKNLLLELLQWDALMLKATSIISCSRSLTFRRKQTPKEPVELRRRHNVRVWRFVTEGAHTSDLFVPTRGEYENGKNASAAQGFLPVLAC